MNKLEQLIDAIADVGQQADYGGRYASTGFMIVPKSTMFTLYKALRDLDIDWVNHGR